MTHRATCSLLALLALVLCATLFAAPAAADSKLSVLATAGSGGSDFGLRVVPRAGSAGYLRDDTPTNEGIFKVSFDIHSRLRKKKGAFDEIAVYQAIQINKRGEDKARFEVLLRERGRNVSEVWVRVWERNARGRAGSSATSREFFITNVRKTFRNIEICWTAASGRRRTNGTFTASVDGTEVLNLTDVRSKFNIDSSFLGTIAGAYDRLNKFFRVDNFVTTRV